jgi:hypothetical protein
MQLSQPLPEDGIARRYAFAREYRALLEDNSGVLNVTWFSDEAHFHLDGYINKQNVRFWTSENPRLSVANPLHPEIDTIWCALSSAEIFGPVFFDGTFTSDVYLSLLSDEFVAFLMRYGIPMNSSWFQQDSDRLQTSSALLRCLHDFFEERVLSSRYPALFEEGFSWPPTSPDFYPCDYFLWGYLKDRVLQKNAHTIPELKTAIQSKIEAISTETPTTVVNNFVLRLHKVRDLRGHNMENVRVTNKFPKCVERSVKVSYSCVQ